MIENVKFTIYEVLGYLFPGAVTAFGLAILFWSLFLPRVPFPMYKQLNIADWVLISLAAYVCGHFTQALGNLLWYSAESHELAPGKSATADVARKSVAVMLGVEPQSIEPKSLFGFCDEYMVQKGQIGDRDIFVYREGFYRGSTVALLLLSLAVAARLVAPYPSVKFADYIFFVSRPQLTVLLSVLLGSALLAYKRFMRFGAYRVNHAITAFVCLTRSENTASLTWGATAK